MMILKKVKSLLTAMINELSLDYEGYGSSEISTPMYIARSYVKAFVLIEFKKKEIQSNNKEYKIRAKI